MNLRSKLIVLIVPIVRQLLALLLMLWLSPNSIAEWYEDSADIMGTRVSVELFHGDKVVAEQAMAAVMSQMRSVDAAMSPQLASSELSNINQFAARHPVVVSDALFSLIDKALFYSRISEGAFDISFASVGQFYNYRQSQAPAQDVVKAQLSAIDYRLIVLDHTLHSIYFKHPQLCIDLGGIAKGYAVDQAIKLLQERGISSAIVSAGGDSRIMGDRQGNPWVIGIRHPRRPGEYAVRIPLVDTAISTSGDYERFYMQGETRIHHILNPDTGQSASEVQSVSILTPLAVDSDALSTTVFVLGVQEGLKLVNGMKGADAIIIDGQGKLHYSDDLLRAVK